MVTDKSGRRLAEVKQEAEEQEFQKEAAKLLAKYKAVDEAMASASHPNAKLLAEIHAECVELNAATQAEDPNWKPIPGFVDHEIHRDGRVRSKHRRIVYKNPRFKRLCTRMVYGREFPFHTVKGHRAVSIKVNRKAKKVYVDSMVRKLFPENYAKEPDTVST